jgi:queuine tRNA-ribosyltransferase
VEFRSHIDGSRQFLSPERSIEIQETLGVDIAMALDECPAATLDKPAVEKSLALTSRWARRSLAARRNAETSIFGITQGGRHRDLRARAAEDISSLEFDGNAIGGVSVGEAKEAMYEVLSYHPAELPETKIRYLMGVGTPEDIVEAVHNGIDLFDCVMPTRSGRFGRAFVSGPEPFLNIKNSKYTLDKEPLDPHCGCIACRRYSKGYIRHLFQVDEMLGPQLVSIHNLTHYLDLMKTVRAHIVAGTFQPFHAAERRRWSNVSPGEEGISQKTE